MANANFFVFANATLLMFDTDKLSSDILYDEVLVTRGGEIEAIIGAHDAVIRPRRRVFSIIACVSSI